MKKMKKLLLLLLLFPVFAFAQLTGQQPLASVTSPSFSSITLLLDSHKTIVTNTTTDNLPHLIFTFEVKEGEKHEVSIITSASVDTDIGQALLGNSVALITREIGGSPIIHLLDTNIIPPGIPGIINPISLVVNGVNVEVYDKGKAATNIVWGNTINRSVYIYNRIP